MTSRPTSDSAGLLGLVADLLRDELGLHEQPPRVFVYNSNFNLPSVTYMILVVGQMGGDPYGQGQGYRLPPTAPGGLLQDGTLDPQNQGGLESTAQVAINNILTVDALSVTYEAKNMLPLITMALQGDAAERLMEEQNLRIFRPEPWTDVSEVEASRRLNRFQTRFAVYQSSGLARPVPWMAVQKNPVGKLLVQA